jgi:hypothetical protein
MLELIDYGYNTIDGYYWFRARGEHKGNAYNFQGYGVYKPEIDRATVNGKPFRVSDKMEYLNDELYKMFNEAVEAVHEVRH